MKKTITLCDSCGKEANCFTFNLPRRICSVVKNKEGQILFKKNYDKIEVRPTDLCPKCLTALICAFPSIEQE